jgi:Tfp pilus assembly protein PilV
MLSDAKNPVHPRGGDSNASSVLSNQQKGFVLPVALFVLVAATILTLAMVKMNMVSLRVGGASVVAQEAQTSAELLLSNFFTRNPIDAVDGKYERGYTPCAASNVAPTTEQFDCRQITDGASGNLPKNTIASPPAVQRIGCTEGPRSNRPSQKGTMFNYNQVATEVTNDFYGSRAQVGMGVAKMVTICP